MPTFARFASAILTRPRSGISAIASSASAADGLAITSVFGGLYGLAAFTSFRLGRRPRGQVLTFIPAERYYLWESVFCLPVTILWMTLSARFARTLSRRLGGRGTLGSDLAMLAYCQSVPMLAAFWLPDISCYILRVPDSLYRRLVPVYGSVALIWALALSTEGIATVEAVSRPRALFVVGVSGAVGAVASGTVFVIR